MVNELSMARLNHRKLYIETSSKLQNVQNETPFIVHVFLAAVAFILADFRTCVGLAGESVTSMMVVARFANASNPVCSSPEVSNFFSLSLSSLSCLYSLPWHRNSLSSSVVNRRIPISGSFCFPLWRFLSLEFVPK